MRSPVIVAILLLSSSSPSNAQSAPPSNARALRESLLKADRDLSAATLKKGMTAAFSDVLADDAYLLYDGAPVIGGKADVIALLSSQDVLKSVSVKWLPLVVATSQDGSIGATWGVTTASSASDSAGPRFGKYINTWRRTANGSWQLAAHVALGVINGETAVPTGLKLPSFDPSSGKGASFAKADLEFAKAAFANGAPAAFAEFAANDAMTLPGTGEIIVGPPAIKARMSESPAAQAKWEWHPVYSEGSASGDFGYTIGEAVITPPGATADKGFKSKYLTVWRRQADGSIRYIVDGGNAR